MSIILGQAWDKRDKIQIIDSEWGLPLLEKRIFIVDTCVLFPTLLPRKRRNVNALMNYGKKLDELKGFTGPMKSLSYRRLFTEKLYRRQIDVINSLEDGEFKKRRIYFVRGIYFGITNAVLNELKTFEGMVGRKNVEGWTNGVRDYVYKIFLNVPPLRRRYESISNMFDESGDFSVAIAGYLLGCNIVTDDYNSFNVPTMKKFKEMYDERWQPGRPFEQHDSESLRMLLGRR